MTHYRIAHEDLETGRQGHSRVLFDDRTIAEQVAAYNNAIWPGQVRFWVEELAPPSAGAPLPECYIGLDIGKGGHSCSKS